MDAPMFSYAGFWKRFVAYIIDSLLLGVVFVVPAVMFGVFSAFSGAALEQDMQDPEMAAGLIGMLFGGMLLFALVAIAATWLYFALMESSSRQATLGKMAMGIIVTDVGGGRIGFGRATGRYFGKIVSGMIMYIGYIMAGFTEKKQALHDMMAGTLVVNR